MDSFGIAQGCAINVLITVRDANGNVITSYTGTESLQCTLAIGGDASLLAATISWLTPASQGLVIAGLAPSQTAGLTPGEYLLTAYLSDQPDPIYTCKVNVTPAPGADAADPLLPAVNTFPLYTNTGPVTNTYATDEHVYIEGRADFGVIVPVTAKMAAGNDGVLSGWVLTSASNNFGSQGVQPGMVVKFTAPTSTFATPDFLVVQAISGTSLTLRRAGFPVGTGRVPAPTGLAGVVFSILSLQAEIEETAYNLNEQYSLDPLMANRTPGDVYDLRIFRRLTCLRVLFLRYLQMNRGAKGDFKDKVDFYSNEYDKALSVARLRWGPTGSRQPSTTRFSTRLGR